MPLSYVNKIILAPMVRIGTLPMRLLSIDYGADIVYTEEIVDFKLLRTERKVNDILNTVDFLDKSDGTVVFRTCKKETEQLVLQLGTSDPDRALQAAKLVENDVAAIDVNMGCPKEFSIKGGMGAALLSNQCKAQAILRKLVGGLRCPVTCKVRILKDIKDTINMCKEFEKCGIAAITVHGRTKDERPQHPNNNEAIRAVAESLTIPVIANGGSKDIDRYEDIDKFKKLTGCSSVMIARAAEWNCSVFRKEGVLYLDEVIHAYLRYAIDYYNPAYNTKYCIQNMLRDLVDTGKGHQFLRSQTLEEMSALWNLGDYCKKKEQYYLAKGVLSRIDIEPVGMEKHKLGKDVIKLHCAFLRHLYSEDIQLPKNKLTAWTDSKGWRKPSYETIQLDRMFQSVVTVNNKKYASTYWEKSKKWAEQASAIVCLCYNDLLSLETLRKNGTIRD